jgi:hypothetical protein
LISPRFTLLSMRRRAALRGGAGRLARSFDCGGRRDELLQPRERVGAILVLASIALGLDDDDAFGGDPLVIAREKSRFDGFGKRRGVNVEAQMQRRGTLLTFWPPAPCARTADHTISFGGIRTIEV